MTTLHQPSQQREHLRKIQSQATSAAAALHDHRYVNSNNKATAALSDKEQRAADRERERAREKKSESKKPILPTAPDVIIDGYGVEYQTGHVLGQVR